MSYDILPKATQHDIKRTFVSKIKNLDPSDPEFSVKFDEIYNNYQQINSISERDNAGKKNLVRYTFDSGIDDFFNNFYNNRLMSFSKLHDKINNTIKQTKFDNLHDDDNMNSYYKYVSSFTTFDDKGQRQAKSISRVEKTKNNKKTVSQITKIQNGDVYIEEHLNPDGTTKKIEKKLSHDDKYIE